jgi:nitrite reductase/ring-hydroxylating ferredoxin subunit
LAWCRWTGASQRHDAAVRRRRFLGLTLELLLLPLAGAVAVMLQRQRDLPENREESLLVPLPPEGGARCVGAVIGAAPARRPIALSSRCPHLGCRIDRVEGDELVCPCHGSRFTLAGAVRRGPATQPLRQLPCTASTDGTQLRVELPRS